MNCPSGTFEDQGKCIPLQMYKPGTWNGTEPVNNNNGDTLGVPNVGSTVKNVTSGLASNALSALLQPLLSTLPAIGIKVGLFLFALVMLIVGFAIVTGGTQ